MKANFFKEKYLLFRAKNKDPEAYALVYDLYADKIYRFIFFKVSNAEEAQDLSSEVFLKTWQYIIDGKEIKNLNAFFYSIARNLVIDHYRKASQKEISLSEIENSEEHPRAEKNEIEKIAQKIQFDKVTEKLGQLKDEYREIIVLRYIEGMSIGEIAQIVDKKKGTVRVILFRALNALRDLLGEAQFR
jgi:RNA polymerase sigma-70 factor (ECF subfamily)